MLPFHPKPPWLGAGPPYRDCLEGAELQVSEVLGQLPRFQVVKKQGHFALFAQAWAAHGHRGPWATWTQSADRARQGKWRDLGCGMWEQNKKAGDGGEGEEGLTHRLEGSPRLLWAELPS